MGNPYPARFKTDDVDRLVGLIDFDDPDNQPGGGLPLQQGADPPLGSVVPVQAGALYLETSGVGIWFAAGVADTDWVLVAGGTEGTAFVGVDSTPGGGVSLVGGDGHPVSVAAGGAFTDNEDGGVLTLDGGSGAGTGDGGRVTVAGGGAPGAGNGGDVQLTPGPSVGGTPGSIKLLDDASDLQVQVTTGAVLMPSLPTADPHVVGQLWNSSGVLTVSAG